MLTRLKFCTLALCVTATAGGIVTAGGPEAAAASHIACGQEYYLGSAEASANVKVACKGDKYVLSGWIKDRKDDNRAARLTLKFDINNHSDARYVVAEENRPLQQRSFELKEFGKKHGRSDEAYLCVGTYPPSGGYCQAH